MDRKHNGVLRICVDYCRLIAATRFYRFSLPLLDKALDAFAGEVVFSLLDLAIAYLHVPFDPSDVEKTAFLTHVGCLSSQRCPSPFAKRRRRISG